MPKSRVPTAEQKALTRGLSQLRTSSDSDPLPRFVKERSPRLGLGDHRSPKGPLSDPMNKKKLSTRIADLESQLGEAQIELKNLKGQLASAEIAKKEAQEKLTRKVETVEEGIKPSDDINDHLWETDVFEVPKLETSADQSSKVLKKPVDETSKLAEISDTSKTLTQDLVFKDEEISYLKATLVRRDTELKVISEENELIKTELTAAKADISTAETKETEMASKLTILGEELKASKAQTSILNEKLQSMERGKAALEAEMKQLRVQTEQWRKAADAAAAVLACDADMNGGRLQDRCGSMGKSFPGVLESPVDGCGGYVGSPGVGEDLGSGKRRSSGIKMFGDLWRKKGNSK